MATQISQPYTFLPTAINGCVLWLDGSDLTTLFTDAAGTIPVTASGQSVGNWKDKSTQANNATNATNQPTVTYNVQNRLPVLTFNAASLQYLNLDGTKLPNGSTNFSYFFVVRTSSANTQVFLANGALVNGQMPQFYFRSSYLLTADLLGASPIYDNVTFNNRFAIATYTSDSTFRGYQFNTAFNGTPGSTSVTLNTGTTYGYVGVSRTGAGLAFYLTGQIAEIVVYSRVVTSSEQQQIEAYLGWKWGLQTGFGGVSGWPYLTNQPFMNTYILPVTPTVRLPAYNNPVFVPTQIAGCVIWFDAADRSTLGFAGSAINTWTSKGSASLTATSVGAGSILYQLYNNQYSLRFNGTNTKMTTGTVASYGASSTTWITASVNLTPFTASTPADASLVFATNGAPEKSIRYTGTNTSQLYTFNNGVIRFSPNTDNGIRGFTDTAAAFTAYVNGTNVTTNTTAVTYQAGVNQSFIMGQWASGTLDGYIQEIIVYNTALTLAQYQQVEGYLAWKWGFQGSLPSTHPYKNSPFPSLGSAPTPAFPIVMKSGIWQPSQLTGVGFSLWLDAADPTTITTSGTTITAVKDKSGTNKSITITNTVSYIPKQAIVFTDTNGRLNVSGMPSAPYDVLTVATANSSNTIFRALLRTLNTANVFLLNINTNDLGIWDGTAFSQFGSLTMNLNEKALVYTTMAVNNTIQASKNGSSTLTAATSPANDSAIAFIGNNSGGGGQPWGTLQEILVFSTTLSQQQRQQVEGYLAWKWGLQGTLPDNHPYKLFPPAP